MDSWDDSEDKSISTEMLEYICGSSQSRPSFNRREAHYKICDRIKQIKSEWKEVLKSTQNMGKGLHKVFKTFVKEGLQDWPTLGESGSEFSYFIPDPINFSILTRFSDEMKIPCLKATQKEIKNIINNQTFIVK